MKYDFDSIIDRNGKDAIAVDIIPFDGAQVKPGFSKIPMWAEVSLQSTTRQLL